MAFSSSFKGHEFMPSNVDRYGARISTKVEEVACAYRHAVDCMLSAWPGALEALDRWHLYASGQHVPEAAWHEIVDYSRQAFPAIGVAFAEARC